ncbi:unnamed protein product [Paramecium sonneborni]|uniref:Uncharacterized protein n=1 Tax=Paramecium sonneborni TaxID=65129 RepID=A0A8S1MEU6_9CILI|nr:unnamed protein product [Paramecium sonneborni]
MSKQNKEEQSAKLKLQEHWHQLIKLKYQGSKQDETHKFQQPKCILTIIKKRLSETKKQNTYTKLDFIIRSKYQQRHIKYQVQITLDKLNYYKMQTIQYKQF